MARLVLNDYLTLILLLAARDHWLVVVCCCCCCSTFSRFFLNDLSSFLIVCSTVFCVNDFLVKLLVCIYIFFFFFEAKSEKVHHFEAGAHTVFFRSHVSSFTSLGMGRPRCERGHGGSPPPSTRQQWVRKVTRCSLLLELKMCRVKLSRHNHLLPLEGTGDGNYLFKSKHSNNVRRRKLKELPWQLKGPTGSRITFPGHSTQAHSCYFCPFLFTLP